MDKRMTQRVERIGAILSIAESAQLSSVEEYLRDFHGPSWELLLSSMAAHGKAPRSTKGVSATLLKAYKSWLMSHDSAWTLTTQILAQPRTTDWAKLAEAVGRSPETCRQTVQALQRGGMP